MNIKLPIWKVTLLISLFLTIFMNFSFWKSIANLLSFKQEPFIFIALFIVILTLINLLLTLVSFKPVFKPIAILLVLTSASAAYFMDNYAVMIDKSMIQNVFATDVHEAKELFSLKMFITIFLLGIVPAWMIYKVEINYQPFFKGLLNKTIVSVICVGVIAGTLFSNYQKLSFFGRNHREVRHLINPTNYLFSLKSIAMKKFEHRNIVVEPIEDDAKIALASDKQRKPSLVLLVLGETARAMNFSLNGYERETNPLLEKQDIINFNDVSSCGTATAVSVPCMFSKFSRDDYSDSKALQYENLLDVVSNAGYDVLWRDNNTGCQGTCKRIEYEDLAYAKNPKFCANGNCVDEILLDDLQSVVDNRPPKNANGDKFIVLHQKGNHGPTYHLRYPEKFEKFKPTCKTNQLIDCSREEVINAYDNAVLYSDYFLDQSIEFLKKNSEKYNTAMLYVSDHGESLGENNLYLHGLPYMIAPDYQKKVPMMVWLSNDYQKLTGINKSCVAQKSSNSLSHDNLFSSMIGLLGIETKVHDPKLDIFASCNDTQLAKNKH